MATKEKWVSLFEQVIGRKPSPVEYMQGKECDFDPKHIKRIAGLGTEKSSVQIDEGAEGAISEVQTTESVVINSESVSSSETVVISSESPISSESSSISAEVEAAPTPTTPVLEKENPVTPNQGASEQQPLPLPVKKGGTKKKKLLIASLIGLVLVVGTGLAATYYYLDSITGMDVAIEQFSTAIDSNDYDQVAKLLSTDKDKWNKSEARDFLNYLKESDIDIEEELEKIEESGGKNTYNDENGNKLFGLKETSRQFLFFPKYQVVSYPVEISVISDIKDLIVEGEEIEPDEEVVIGAYHFANQSLSASGSTKLGEFETKVTPNLHTASENKLLLSLMTVKKDIKVSLPDDVKDISDIKVMANDQQIAKSLDTTVEVIENQSLEVNASFTFEGKTYETESTTIVVAPTEDSLAVTLELSDEETEKLSKAQKAKADKTAATKAAEERKTKIYNFIFEYRSEVFYSVEHRTNTYAKYYDTASEAYKAMVEFTEGGGAAKAQIDEYTPLALEIRSVKEDGDNLIVETYEEFNSSYLNSNPDKVFKRTKQYHLRPTNGTYVIYELHQLSSN
ncbi:TPA: hypothetical protein TXL57_001068 [Streptococcus suis]|nr:hypothetical protein [Streptococcus suis]